MLAADCYEADAGDLTDMLGKHILGVIVDLRQRQLIRRDRKHEDGGVRRVDLAVSRWRRKIGRQLPASGVDRRLHVLRGAVDVAREIELDGDSAVPERAARRHFRDAGNLSELAFQRLGNGGRHGFGIGARQLRRHLNGREVHLRQRGDGEERISGGSDEQDRRHQQRRRDRPLDERRREAHCALLGMEV